MTLTQRDREAHAKLLRDKYGIPAVEDHETPEGDTE
jgi:hypothetical protein